MKKIEIAPLFRRIVAAFMDAIFAFFLYFILVTYVATPIARKATTYDADVSDIYQYEISSHLYMWMQQDDTGKYQPIEVKDFSEKINNQYLQRVNETRNVGDFTLDQRIAHLQYYYTVYLTGDLTRVELPNNTESKTYDAVKDHFVSPHYLDKIDGKLPSEIYTKVYFNTKIMGLAPEGEENQSPYYSYPVVDDHVDYEGLPVLKEGANKDEAINDINKRLYDATKEFYYTDYMQSLQGNVRAIQLWCYIPTYLFVVGGLYILIPMLFKDGATLGKKTLCIAVISKLGYRAKKRQILFRQLIFLVEISFSLFIVGFGLTSIATLGIGAVIILIVMLTNKERRSPHDFAAMTLAIDEKTSVYFDNATEEERKQNRVNANLEKLNSYEPENANIIQVGSKIVDKDLKKKIDKKRGTSKKEK